MNDPEKAGQIALQEPLAQTAEKRGLFGKKKPIQYGIPADQYAPPTMAHNSQNRFIPGVGEIVPLSAGSQNSVRPSAPTMAAQTPPQPTALPYRVQFGAFRSPSYAVKMRDELLRSGIRAMIIPSSSRSYDLVVTEGGFASAEEAQRWITYEGTRRGWRDRPLVIR